MKYANFNSKQVEWRHQGQCCTYVLHRYICDQWAQHIPTRSNQDIGNGAVQESQQFEGQVLVAREAEGHKTGAASHVVDHYEPVAGTSKAKSTCSALWQTLYLLFCGLRITAAVLSVSLPVWSCMASTQACFTNTTRVSCNAAHSSMESSVALSLTAATQARHSSIRNALPCTA